MRKRIELLVGILFSFYTIYGQVVVEDSLITIPTYTLNPPDKNPFFYLPEGYQGAQLRIYPYVNNSYITGNKQNKVYKALYLENEYIRLCVLPELGGRLYYAIDKQNGYDLIYRNHVIKPALIGMTGAWISGGVEWNIPHHHRGTTVMPVNYTIEEHRDGSKTIWVGETEKRSETRWVVGITLYPGKAFIEASIRYLNSTPVTRSFLVWANTAVHANANYQVIFPPDVERAVFHGKTQFIDYPLANQVYQGIDFRGNVDISYWKNTFSPTSFFAWGSQMDFMAGYDHGKNAGTLLVGDHYIFPGKKFWNWGNNDVQRLWDKMLTDNDGPYLELMMGMYSDNQPDYSWNSPFGIKEGTMYYAPLKNMSSVKNANKTVALNFEYKSGALWVEMNAYEPISNAKLVINQNNTEKYKEEISINPQKTFRKEIPFKEDAQNLTVQLLDSLGRELISYGPKPKKDLPVPDCYHAPKNPSDIKTVDELYLTGLRIEQFHNARLDPLKYYQQALKIDSSAFLVNTQMGIDALKNYNYPLAEKYLQRAVSSVTGNYTKPRYAESLYYLGLVYFRQGRREEARNMFMQAAWDNQWKAPALYMASQTYIPDDLSRGIFYLNTSLQAQKSVETLNLLSSLYRITGEIEKARQTNAIAVQTDPLNPVARFEQYLSGDGSSKVNVTSYLGDQADNYLDIASFYFQAGLFREALESLKMASESSDNQISGNPLVYYYRQFVSEMLGDKQEAALSNERARKCSLDYCFPHGDASLMVLRKVTEWTNNDANAFYLLGNVLCDPLPQDALTAWERAAALKPGMALVYRNMAFVYANGLNQMEKAVAHMEKAIALNPDDPEWLQEADSYYDYMGKSPQDRLNFLKLHDNTVNTWDKTILRKVDLLIATGKYDEALQLLTNTHFYIAEITTLNPHKSWSFAHLMRGVEKFSQHKYKEALTSFNAMGDFPRNIEIARDLYPQLANYWIGKIYLADKNAKEARNYFEKLINNGQDNGWGAEKSPLIDFYRAKSQEELGQNAIAKQMYNQLIDEGEKSLQAQPAEAINSSSVKVRQSQQMDKAMAYLSMTLGYIGQHNYDKARECYGNARRICPAALEISTLPNLVEGNVLK